MVMRFLKIFQRREMTPAAAAPAPMPVSEPVAVAVSAPAPAPAANDTTESVHVLHKRAQAAMAAGDVETALANLTTILRLDPTRMQARAEYGRLRFVRPEQPFITEIAARHGVPDVCEVTLEIRNPCNFRCDYCVAKGHNDVPVQPIDHEAIARVYEGIAAQLIVTSLDCGGGEPTIHPQFPDLIRVCSHYGAVSFPSNNSQNPARWLPRETASRIAIRSALHPEAEAALDKYTDYARHLLDAGCHFTALFVAHPTRLDKIETYRQFFAERRIPFVPVSFLGEYNGQQYPHAYTAEEQRMLGLNDGERIWYHRIEPHVTRIRNFRALPCIAGFKSMMIKSNGQVSRCNYDHRPLEAPLTAPAPCRVKHCGCGLMLDGLNLVESLEYFNGWASVAGVARHDVGWMGARATELGYASVQDALATEHTRMYDELMRAYGKDEFPEP